MPGLQDWIVWGLVALSAAYLLREALRAVLPGPTGGGCGTCAKGCSAPAPSSSKAASPVVVSLSPPRRRP